MNKFSIFTIRNKCIYLRKEQTLAYKSEANFQHGPFHITPEKREARWHTDEVPFTAKKLGPKEKPKAGIIEELMRTSYGTSEARDVLAKNLVRDLQKMAGNLGIQKNKMLTHRKRNRWENQGKGLLQVLYERGWIDKSGISKYNMQVVDEDREFIPQLSLIHMMETSPDFSNEAYQLGYFFQKLGS